MDMFFGSYEPDLIFLLKNLLKKNSKLNIFFGIKCTKETPHIFGREIAFIGISIVVLTSLIFVLLFLFSKKQIIYQFP